MTGMRCKGTKDGHCEAKDIILISTQDLVKKHVRQYYSAIVNMFLETALVMGIYANCVKSWLPCVAGFWTV